MAEDHSIFTQNSHLPGITRLCFSPDGETIFTGGTDCLVRFYPSSDHQAEPGFHDQHDEAVTSLTCSNTKLVTGCVDNQARTFDYPEHEFSGILVRSTSVPIRFVCFDKQGARVAVCSDDLLVKIVNVADPTDMQRLTDNAKPVRSATWDPSGQYLTTISCDAKLKIYDMSAGDSPICLKVFDNVVSSSEPDAPTVPKACWHPSGAYFIVPTRTQEIAVFQRGDSWARTSTFAVDGHDSGVGELAWSADGRYLASAGLGSDHQILIWEAETKEIVKRHRYDGGLITGLEFSPDPKENLLAFTAADGTFHRWSDVLPAVADTKMLNELAGDDVEAGDEEDVYGEDWIIDDDGGIDEAKEAEREKFVGNQVVSVKKAQPAFTPGSTAMRNKKRYLDFNMIGVIDVTDQETHHVVNVEFHDKSARRGYHFQDHDLFSLASLGERGVIYASTSEPSKPSVLSYRAYDAGAAQSDWRIALPQDEDIVLVASGGAAETGMGTVMVVTSKGLVRFFTSSGLQRYVWRMADEMVSMAAGKELGLMIHREGGTSLDGCQNLRYTVLDLENFDLLQEGRVPLAKKATLVWVGFTAEGAPAMYDSDGMLSVLDRFRRPGQSRWVPLLDTNTLARKTGKDESYWPVGVAGSNFTCLILKGKETEPYFPRPLIHELEVHLPILNYDQADGQIEEHFVRGELELSTLREAADQYGEVAETIRIRQVELDKELLRLVQSACKADKIQRALDITRLMFNPGTLQAAIQVANYYQLPGLKDRIEGVLKAKERRKGGETRAQRYEPGRHDSPLDDLPPQRAAANAARHTTDFVPRIGGPRRSYGSTPAPTLPPSRAESFIPETPTDSPAEFMDDISPVKRKRDEREDSVEEIPAFEQVPKKRPEPVVAQSAKNPFARKPPASNPFARQANAVPLNTVKSTSFFERVDNIEQHDRVKSNTKAKAEKYKEPKARQTTLLGLAPLTGAEKLKKFKMGAPPAPVPVHQASTETQATEIDETQDERPVLDDMEETQMADMDETQRDDMEETHMDDEGETQATLVDEPMSMES